MSKPVKPIPDGYTALTPYLIVNGAAGAIEFYQKILGPSSCFDWRTPAGRSGTPSS